MSFIQAGNLGAYRIVTLISTKQAQVHAPHEIQYEISSTQQFRHATPYNKPKFLSNEELIESVVAFK